MPALPMQNNYNEAFVYNVAKADQNNIGGLELTTLQQAKREQHRPAGVDCQLQIGGTESTCKLRPPGSVG